MGDGINPDGAQCLLGRGKVYFDRLTAAGLHTGERFLGDCTAFEITPTVETKDKYGSTDPTGALLARAVVRSAQELSIEFGEFDPDNLALVLLGEKASLVQAATPVVDEAIAASGVFMNRWYKLANRAMGSVVVRKGVTVLTVTTDYVMDLVNGRILFVSGGPGGVVEGDTTLECDYTPTSKTYTQVRGGTQAKIEGKIVYIGDSAKGPNYHVEAWLCQVAPDGGVPFIGQDWAAGKLKGAVQSDAVAHPTAPYFLMTLIPTS